MIAVGSWRYERPDRSQSLMPSSPLSFGKRGLKASDHPSRKAVWILSTHCSRMVTVGTKMRAGYQNERLARYQWLSFQTLERPLDEHDRLLDSP